VSGHPRPPPDRRGSPSSPAPPPRREPTGPAYRPAPATGARRATRGVNAGRRTRADPLGERPADRRVVEEGRVGRRERQRLASSSPYPWASDRRQLARRGDPAHQPVVGVDGDPEAEFAQRCTGCSAPSQRPRCARSRSGRPPGGSGVTHPLRHRPELPVGTDLIVDPHPVPEPLRPVIQRVAIDAGPSASPAWRVIRSPAAAAAASASACIPGGGTRLGTGQVDPDHQRGGDRAAASKASAARSSLPHRAHQQTALIVPACGTGPRPAAIASSTSSQVSPPEVDSSGAYRSSAWTTPSAARSSTHSRRPARSPLGSGGRATVCSKRLEVA
jgi:hypothetical protein